MTDNGYVARAVASQEDWDAIVREHGGHLLQSWKWGEFRRQQGWLVERILVESVSKAEVGIAQILFKEVGWRIPWMVAYIPRGPVLKGGDDLALALIHEVDAVCRRRHAISLIIEPNDNLPDALLPAQHGFHVGPPAHQPERSMKVTLDDDASMIKRMRRSMRPNVRNARKHGISVEQAGIDQESLATFYHLLEETAERERFGIRHPGYYESFLTTFSDDAILLLAKLEGAAAAGLIAAKFGDEAIYMYGGSSVAHRRKGASAVLQFEAMRWARDAGCTRYDLWGDALKGESTPTGPEKLTGLTQPSPPMQGLAWFKAGFGGEEVSYPPTVCRHFSPVWGRLVCAIDRRRSSPLVQTARRFAR